MSDRPVHIRNAHAKLNLALAVSPPIDSGERAGWHEITSWFVSVSLHDTLSVTRLEEDRLSRYAILWASDAARATPIDWSITRDLAVRAHRSLEERAGGALPVQMKLEKRIPVGGGLGGGSSNGASMLLATRALFPESTSEADLCALAGALGSDVSFFLDANGSSDEAPARPALVEGFGDRVERLDRVKSASGGAVSAVLIFPDIACPTPAVYRAFDAIDPQTLAAQSGPGSYKQRATRVREAARAGIVDPDALFNDLAPAAQAVAASLAELRVRLSGLTGLQTFVTGSGSTLFQIGQDPDHAAHLAETIGAHIPRERAAVTPVDLL